MLRLILVLLLALALTGCTGAPDVDDENGRFVVRGAGPENSRLVLDNETGRCFLVSRTYNDYTVVTPAPGEWCR